MKHLKIVTFNIRYDCEADGKQNFKYRKPIILQKILQEKPDLIGFQELQDHMLEWLEINLPDYLLVGCGRECNYSGEHNSIAIKKSVFELLKLDTFWLSPTPNKPGSRFEDQSACPRICTWVELREKESGKIFRCYNTHLDHETALARELGLAMIMEAIDQVQVPLLLMGDFNAEPESKELRLLRASKAWQDCTQNIEYSYHEFGNLDQAVKIDYIYLRGELLHMETKLWNECVEGIYLSDHYPIEINLGI